MERSIWWYNSKSSLPSATNKWCFSPFIQAVRMLDEGIVQSNLYSENEIRKYKDNDFRNIIYEVQDGEFSEQINQISDGYGEALNLKHYVVITQNYNIDIVTEWEPTIEISKM